MALIASLKSWAVQEVVKAADLNGNFSAIRTAFNTTAVLTDTPATITVSHTWSATQSFPAGSTIAGYLPLSGGTLTGGLTGTTATLSGALSAGTATFSGTVQSTGTYGFAIGSVSAPRIQYGSDTGTSFSFLTAAGGYADLHALGATLSGAFTHTGSTFGAFGATPHAKQTISGGLTGTDAYAQALGIVLQNLGLVAINNTTGTITVTG